AHATKSNGKAPLAYTSTYIYDIASNSWTTGPNMNSPHSWTGGTNVGNRLIVVGGFNGSTGDTNIVEMSIVPVVACGTATATATAPVATATRTATASPTTCATNYNYTLGTGTMIT